MLSTNQLILSMVLYFGGIIGFFIFVIKLGGHDEEIWAEQARRKRLFSGKWCCMFCDTNNIGDNCKICGVSRKKSITLEQMN